MVLVSVHAGAQVVGAQVGSQELAGREQADGEAQADMVSSDVFSGCFVVIVIL